MLVKYNPNNWFYRSIESIEVHYVTVNKNDGYKVNANNVTCIPTTLAKLRVIDREHLNENQLQGEYKRILQGKIQSTLEDGVTVVDILSYNEVSEKIAFTIDELRQFGHKMIETDDGFMIEK